MNKEMKRRDFVLTSALAAGGVLVAANSLFAKEHQPQFKGYYDVDKELFTNINKAKDDAEKSTLEKKHIPLIDAPDKAKAGEPFEVKVTIGEIIHPMSQTHYIHEVELYAGNEPAGSLTLSPQFNEPIATFTIKLDKPVTLVVREYCNLHGLWENRKNVDLA